MGLRTRIRELGFVPYRLTAEPELITGMFIIPDKNIWLEMDIRWVLGPNFKKYRLYSRSEDNFLYINEDTVAECLDEYENLLKLKSKEI